MTLKRRLLISLVVVAALPLLSVSALLFQNSVQAIQQQQREAAYRLLESQCDHFDRVMERAYQSLIQLLSTPDLIAMLSSMESEEIGGWAMASRLDSVSTAIHSAHTLNNELFEIIGVFADQTQRTVLRSFSTDDRNAPLFYPQVKAAAGMPVWIVMENDGAKEIYLAGATLRPSNNDAIGMVYLKIRYSYLLSLVDIYSKKPGEFFFLFDHDKLIVYSGGEALSEEMLRAADTVRLNGASSELVIGNNRFLASTAVSDTTDWSMVYLTDTRRIMEAALSGTQYILLIAAVTLAAAVFLAAGLSYSAYRPVKELTGLISSIDRESLNAHAKVHFKGDLGVISYSVNTMLERIQNLIAEVEQEKEAKLTAEMTALRAQINPHFLYNTLSAIKCLAVSGQSAEAERVCVCLIRLLRTSVGNSRDCITLDEELNYVNNYTEIMSFRVDKQFEIHYQIEDSTRTLLVSKFTLQPIVENCIIHGFLNESDGNDILVTAEHAGPNLQICVADNGKGIEQGKIRELEEALQTRQGLNFSKVGILNVNERIRHLFGDHYGIAIKSAEQSGTRILINLPTKRDAAKEAMPEDA